MARIDSLLRSARAQIPPEDAEELLAHVLGRPRGWLYAHGDDEPDPEAAQRFAELLARRVAGEPVAYLTGRRGFWSLELQVTPATLIPRPETELLVELALARLPTGRPVRVADLGTGSGAIALALAHERRDAQVIATDASAAALTVARGNAQRCGLGNVEFRQGNWFEPIAHERFDLIASNPPYIAESDLHLQQGDLRFEPREALASGVDGLAAIRTLAKGAAAHLQPGGWLLLEHGWDQATTVRALLRAEGLVEVDSARDLARHERISFGRRPDAIAGPGP